MKNNQQNVTNLFRSYYSDRGEKVVNYILNRDAKLIEYINDFLQANETLEKFTEASFEYDYTKSSEGYLWSTNKRIFFAGTKNGGFLKTPDPVYKEFSYEIIATIQYDKGRLFSSRKIILHVSTNSAKGNVANVTFNCRDTDENTLSFIDYIKQKVVNTNNSLSETEDGDFISQLERLGRLKSQGVITEQEFLAAKKKLLNT